MIMLLRPTGQLEDTAPFYSTRYNPRMHFFSRREALAGAALAFPFRNLLALPLSEIKLGVTTDEIDDDVATAAKLTDKLITPHQLKQPWDCFLQ